MAKKKKDSSGRGNIFEGIEENIIEQSIGTLATEVMKIHGANVNLARAVPDFMDGLKVVARRILYTMYEIGANPNKSRTKVNAITGITMERYHPHGDASETLAGLAQYWNLMIPYIDGQGNFGTPMGDPPAAGRYIEARLSPYAYDCFFSEYYDGISDMIQSYNPKFKMPAALPCKYPNLLINGSTGIGYGLAVGIPPHNPKEVMMAAISLIKNPKTKIALYPDSPTGCIILNKSEFGEISRDGKGSFRMKAHSEIDDKNNIIFTSIPYQTNNMAIVESMMTLVRQGKLNGIADIIDHSTRGEIKIMVITKPGFNPIIIRNEIYKKTQLMNNFTVMYEVVAYNKNTSINQRGYLLDWLEYRRQTKYRFHAQKLSKTKRRIYILDAIIKIIIESDDSILAEIRKAKNRTETIEKFIKLFKISDVQAEAIAEFKLYQLAKENIQSFRDELTKLLEEEKNLVDIIANPERIDEMIIEELQYGIKKYGCDRKSIVIDEDDDNAIPDTMHRIVYTQANSIKKLDIDVTTIGNIKQGDKAIDIIKVSNRDNLLIFDSAGKAYKLPVNTIPQSQLNKIGNDIRTYVNIIGDVVSIIRMPDEEISEVMDRIIFITSNGNIKATETKEFISTSTVGIIAIKLDSGDRVTAVKLASSNHDVLLFNQAGLGMTMHISALPCQLRGAKGVRALKGDFETIDGVNIFNKYDITHMLTVTNKGKLKKMSIDVIPYGDRTKAPVVLTGLDEGDSLNSCIFVNESDNDEIAIICKQKKDIISVTDIPTASRIGKGKKLVAVPQGEQIIDVIRLMKSPEID